MVGHVPEGGQDHDAGQDQDGHELLGLALHAAASRVLDQDQPAGRRHPDRAVGPDGQPSRAQEPPAVGQGADRRAAGPRRAAHLGLLQRRAAPPAGVPQRQRRLQQLRLPMAEDPHHRGQHLGHPEPLRSEQVQVNDVVRATYRIESLIGATRAAEVLAGEQSTGTFVRVQGETDELRAGHAARLVDVTVTGTAPAPSLPGAQRPATGNGAGGDRVEVATVVVDFPLANFGPSIPNLLAAVAGNLFELRELAGCRLLDLELPDAFRDPYPGPQFGVRGTRRLMDAPTGAMVGGIIKPSIGLSPEDHAAKVEALALAGADFCKDDELIADPPYSPFADRVARVMEAIDRAAQRTGRKLMYAFNLTGDISELRRRHDTVVEAGGTCVMACVNLVGFPGIRYLREFSEVPIHGHRAMMGALMRHPALGIDFRAFQKLARLAGVDHLHTNGMDNKFYETNDEVRASIEAVR